MTRPFALLLSLSVLAACSTRVAGPTSDASASAKAPMAAAPGSPRARLPVPKAVPPAPVGVGEVLPKFRAQVTDLSGPGPVKKDFDSHEVPGITAYVFLGTTCPASRAYLERFREIERAYRPTGVTFVYVYPNRTDTAEVKARFHKDAGFGGAMLDDQGGRVARLLRARRGSETLLVAKDRKILFRGGIDDSRDAARVQRRHLALALDEHLAGKAVTRTQTPVFA